jgi:hypothetical protein
MKKFICRIFGHKPKEYPPLQYWVEGTGAVDLPHKPIFCARCGCGEFEMILDKMK